ncbi:MAG: DNA polymerase III subunit gamma/tau [Bacteroidales bacterium]
MENFIVSARKYRPSTFALVVGQKSITTTLKNAIKNNHLAHAYLFCGPRGVGKTTCARIFAKTINCLHLSNDIEPCNECESCHSFNSNRSFNIHELDAASNNSVEDIRSLIDQVRIPPQMGKFSIYIIDEVHMLSSQAFNAFLKTLEEPPAHAIFILATTEKHKIIPTILSRCQIFDFNRIGIDDITHHLEFVARNEGIKAEMDALNIIAQKADGALRDALSYFDQIVSFAGGEVNYQKVIDNLNVLDYEYYFRLTEYFLVHDFRNALLIFDQILNKGFDGHHFISGLAKHFRDLLVGKNPETIKLLEVGDGIKEKYHKQSQNCSLHFLFEALNITNACDLAYKASQDKRLQVELALINISKINLQLVQNVEKKTLNEIDTTQAQETETNKAENQGTANGNKTTLSSISIKEALKGNVQSKQEIKKNEESTESVQKLDIPKQIDFTAEQLKGSWIQYAESIKQDKPRIYHILTACDPKKTNNNIISFAVKNALQKEAIEKIQSELIGRLSQKLQYNLLKLEIEIVESDQKTQLYTDTDKYKYLSEINSNLNKLKQQFNLDF